MTPRFWHSESGFGFVAVLLAMLVAAVLYFGYFHLQNVSGERSTATNAIDNSRAFACRTNRQQIERQITMWQVNHPGETPTLDALDAESGPLPSCPQGGHYSLSGQHVLCSFHR